MSNRKPKRVKSKIKMTPSLMSKLTNENKVDRFSWIVDKLKITLNPTKGYSVSKLPDSYFAAMKEIRLAAQEQLKALEEKLSAPEVPTESSEVAQVA